MCSRIRNLMNIYPQKTSALGHIPSRFSLCWKTLTCKSRLNCAVEPDSLCTDARSRATFKGLRKNNNSKFKKGDEANSASTSKLCNHATKITIWKRQKTLIVIIDWYCTLSISIVKFNLSACFNGCLVTVERSLARRRGRRRRVVYMSEDNNNNITNTQ